MDRRYGYRRCPSRLAVILGLLSAILVQLTIAALCYSINLMEILMDACAIMAVDKKGKSPLEDIPCITADITTQGIVDLIRESRAGI